MFHGTNFNLEFLRRDLFAARLLPGFLELFLQTGECWRFASLDPFALLDQVLNANIAVARADRRGLFIFRPPSIAEYLTQRTEMLERPAGWLPPSPWAVLAEIVLNLDAVQQMHYEAPVGIKPAATLILKASPAPLFRLNLLPPVTVEVAAAVRAGTTFVCDDVDLVLSKLPTSSATSLRYREEPTTLSNELKKRGR